MNRTVWKYELAPDKRMTIHGGAPRVVHVGVDPAGHYFNQPTVWVELDPGGDDEIVLWFIGTGFDVPTYTSDDGEIFGEHVGSCITAGGFVWHVYKVS